MHILRPAYYLTTGMHSYPKLDIIFSLLFDFYEDFSWLRNFFQDL